MHILVTNDDGVAAAGLLTLAQELLKTHQVTILAPDRNWSASGHVKTMHRPLRVNEILLDGGMHALTTDGAPSDCVALAMLGLIEEKIDIVVSGINPNANIGHDVTYSGTVTAAMEAAIWGIPGIAVSLDSPEHHSGELNYGPAARIANQVVEMVINRHLESKTILNVNVPYGDDESIKGFQITRQGLRVYHDRLDRRVDPRGREYYWIGGDLPTGVAEEGTDYGSLSKGYVSITPLQLDLTATKMLETLRDWEWS
ncbi:MAG: 5'/3'-nucleotidase SurE [Anaerolineales bacterium]|jgi:5'-nucleotidase